MPSFTLVGGFTYEEGGASTPASGSFDFVGASSEVKAFTLRSMIPQWYNAEPGTRLWSMLTALGNSDADVAELDLETSAIAQARAAVFIDSAAGEDLSIIGQNFGIPRPIARVGDDVLYRALIKALAFAPRGTMRPIYAVVEAFFGPQSTGGWRIFDPGGNKIVIWLVSLIESRLPSNASYLHLDETIFGEPNNLGSIFSGDYLMVGPTFSRDNTVIKLGTNGNLIAGPSFVGDLVVRPTGQLDGYTPAHFFSTSGGFVSPYTLAIPNGTPTLIIQVPNPLDLNYGVWEIVVTPNANIGEPRVGPRLNYSLTPTAQNWKHGDLFVDPAGAFSPADIGSTLNIVDSSTPSNNRHARVLAYLSNTQIFIEPGATPIVTDAGPITWQLYRGVTANAFYVTGNQLLQDLQLYLQLTTMLGVVVVIGNSTT